MKELYQNSEYWPNGGQLKILTFSQIHSILKILRFFVVFKKKFITTSKILQSAWLMAHMKPYGLG